MRYGKGVAAAAILIISTLLGVGLVFLCAEENPGQMTIARLRYGGGGDWYNDPSIIGNLGRAIKRRTGIEVSDREAVVSATDTELFQYPFIFMTGHGNVRFSEREITRLRSYVEAGGFLYADDDYGMDESFRREMKRIFPDTKMVELPLGFPLYHIPFEFPEGLPKIHEHDGKPPQGFGLFLDGRLVVFYTYETNISDGWADAEVHGDPGEKREQALRMGVNIFVYALTH